MRERRFVLETRKRVRMRRERKCVLKKKWNEIMRDRVRKRERERVRERQRDRDTDSQA